MSKKDRAGMSLQNLNPQNKTDSPSLHSFHPPLIPVLTSSCLMFLLPVCPIKVCKDVNECEGPNNGGCVENSVCMNTPVSMNTTDLKTVMFKGNRWKIHGCRASGRSTTSYTGLKSQSKISDPVFTTESGWALVKNFEHRC